MRLEDLGASPGDEAPPHVQLFFEGDTAEVRHACGLVGREDDPRAAGAEVGEMSWTDDRCVRADGAGARDERVLEVVSKRHCRGAVSQGEVGAHVPGVTSCRCQ